MLNSKKNFDEILNYPLYFSVVWIIMPFVFMALSPFKFKIDNLIFTFSYVCLNVLFFTLGYIIFCKINYETRILVPDTKNIKRYIYFGFWLSLLLLPVSVGVYTGKSIYDIYSVIDQKAVYEALGDVLSEESSSRKLVTLIRGFVAPFAIGAMCLSVFYWNILSRGSKLFTIGIMLTYIVISAFRGTDKEIGDIVIMSIAGLLCRLGYDYVNIGSVTRRKIIRSFSIMIIILSIFFVLFIFRKSERLGGAVSFCLYSEAACFESDSESDILKVVDFSWAILSSYIVQGYYGLSLALDLDYDWTFGIGHSHPLQTLVGFFFDTTNIYENGLMAQLKTVGWDDKYVWSSFFTSWASDISFFGVPILLFVVGSIYGRSWALLLSGKSLASIVVFSLITMLVLYIPSNNQLTQSFDLYFTTIFWFVFLLFGKKIP